jgi:coproporphyrinogen III oxidase
MKPDAQLVKTFLLQLQDEICQKLAPQTAVNFRKITGSGSRWRRAQPRAA